MIKNEMFWRPNIFRFDLNKYKKVRIWEPTVCRASKIGWGTTIGAFCDIGKGVEIGANCLIQSSCIISNDTYIGDEVFLGPGVNILNDKYMNGTIEPVTIDDRVHISGGTLINPGVTIGHDVLIMASGALITRDLSYGMTLSPMSRGNSQFGKRVVW